RPRLADRAECARPARQWQARPRPMAGHLLLRVRRASRAHRVRHDPRLNRAPAQSSDARLSSMAAPVAKNEELELPVDSLAYGGNGVARLNGFVVFVRRAVPGDTVRARVTKVKRGYAEATTTEVLVPSPERIDAPCRHYYEGCGGCRFQDLRYGAQIAAK